MQTYYTKALTDTNYLDNVDTEYRFISPKCKVHKVQQPKFIFYQIAGFINRIHNKHEVRLVYINGFNLIDSIDDRLISSKNYKKLIRAVPHTMIKIYSVDSLEHIDIPRTADISIARSCILNDHP